MLHLTQPLDINRMPVYSFRNKKTNEIYDLTLSYDEMLKYKKKRNVEYILSAPKIFRLNDLGGKESEFRDWCKQPADDIDISKSNNFRQSKNEYLYGDEKDK